MLLFLEISFPGEISSTCGKDVQTVLRLVVCSSERWTGVQSVSLVERSAIIQAHHLVACVHALRLEVDFCDV